MGIRKIRIKNFKSFKELEVDLDNFNVLIGANASGKSNFIHIFEFLRDIDYYGLDSAISLQGDIEFLTNLNLGPSRDFSVEVISDLKTRFTVATNSKEIVGIKAFETSYKFTMKSGEQRASVQIVEDKLNMKCEFVRLELKKDNFEEKETLGQGELIVINDEGKLKCELNKPENVPIEEEDLFPRLLFQDELEDRTLLLETHIFHRPFHIASIFQDISIYNIDPKSCKRATPISGRSDLEEDGCNLAIVLKNILKDKEKKRKFINLIGDILSFIYELDVEKFGDKTWHVKFQEIYSKEKYFPASLVSDGTINITALIVALYFEHEQLTIIEEPDRNIHPYLLSKLVNLMKEASVQKQIIITTHNPEIVKHADLKDLLLVSRDKEGFSVISRPIEKEEIKIFLKNEMGIEELYVQNLLEV